MSEEYYEEIRAFGISFGFYYNSKKHRYTISINYGEKYLDVTKKEGKTIKKFLRMMKEFSRNSKDSSTSKEDERFQRLRRGAEKVFREAEADFGLIKERINLLRRSTDSPDKTDFEDEWDSFEKDQLAQEICGGLEQ